MKKQLSLLLTVVLCAGLCACGGNDAKEEAAEETAAVSETAADTSETEILSDAGHPDVSVEESSVTEEPETTPEATPEATPEVTPEKEPEGYWGDVSRAEKKNIEFFNVILPLNDRFEYDEEKSEEDDVYYVDGDLVMVICDHIADYAKKYTLDKYKKQEFDSEGNPVSGPWDGKIENMIWSIKEFSYGRTEFYYSFAAAGDTYHINVILEGEAAEDRDAAREWLFDLVSETDLTEEGWEKEEELKNATPTPTPTPEPTESPEPTPEPLPETDKEEGQAIYMSTFEALTGTSPAEFTASDPQPWTICIVETGEEYSKGNRPVKFADKTEEEMSEDMKYTISDWEISVKYDDGVLIYTSDPNRASVILVENREYVDSGREYGNGSVTAYSCIYTATVYNTKTHESATYQQTMVPGFTIEVHGNVYYESSMTLDQEYHEWRGTALSWLRPE